MVKKLLYVSMFLLVSGSLGLSVYLFMSRPKMAYVYNDRIFNEYEGVKVGRATYQKQIEIMQANLDTLSNNFKAEVTHYKKSYNEMSDNERMLKEQLLQRQENDILNYKVAIEKQAAEQENAITQGVITQINNFVVEYGKRSGYDYILGVTDNGNILYGPDGDDITDEVIEAINNQYQGDEL